MADFDIASHGFSAAPAPYDRSEGFSRLGQAAAGLAMSAFPDPQRDATRALARERGAEATLKERQLEGYSQLGALGAQLAEGIRTNPQQAAENFQQVWLEGIRRGVENGVPAEALGEYMMQFTGGLNLDNSTLMRLRTSVGGSPLGSDQALTEERQGTIRQENFGQQTALNNADNATSIRRTSMSNAISRANNADSIAAADRREREKNVDFSKLDDVDAEINAQIGDGAEIDPTLKAAVRSRTLENAKQGMNPAAAVQKAISDLTERTVDKDWFSADDVRYSAKPQPTGGAAPSGAAGSPSVSVAPAPATRKAGQTYNTPKGPMVWTGTGWRPVQ